MLGTSMPASNWSPGAGNWTAGTERKMNHLFFNFISLPETQKIIEQLFEAAKAGTIQQKFDELAPTRRTDSPLRKICSEMPPSSPRTPASPRNQELSTPTKPAAEDIMASDFDTPPSLESSLVSNLTMTPIPPRTGAIRMSEDELASLLREGSMVPPIYDPESIRKPRADTVRELAAIDKVFEEFPNGVGMLDRLQQGRAHPFAFRDVLLRDVCRLPGFFGPLMFRQISAKDLVGKEEFVTWYNAKMRNKDDAERFVSVLAPDDRSYLEFSDFLPPLEILLDSHPGLDFLKETPEFQLKYIRTIVCRIMFAADESNTGRVGPRHLRRADIVSAFREVDQTEDVNAVLRFFSYEHFYVIYCKFWELDRDHDHLLSETDLAAYGNYSLSTRCVERIFQEVPRRFTSGVRGMMGFEDFVWFILAEEDKNQLPSQRYWFSIADRDGDGFTTPADFEYFFTEQQERLRHIGFEEIELQDARCQMIDMVNPPEETLISLDDIRRSLMPANYYNLIFNLNKLMMFERKDPYTYHFDASAPEQCDWDRWARVEYDRLEALDEDDGY
ncbi:EF-hand domain pair [Carpediemonas membranifera]|uniref:EF-hand domain pair n=1 Tax=Carpediemonas membranifera TaxID=201153 RepID=A0A8J6BG85_9EUKA|nr:EF-hand domain pair [Carpediemonas membranifera]|eukprot:KAG9396852.1 EF-hand domain pair [Carpediemonas membranifera]